MGTAVQSEQTDLSPSNAGATNFTKTRLSALLRLFSQPQVRSRVIAIRELIQAVQLMA